MIELNTPKEIIELIAKKIENSRIKKELTQKELARRAGITYGSYRNLIDIQKISLLNFIAILHSLGLLFELENLTTIKKPHSIEEMKNKKEMKKRVRKRK